MNSCKGKSGQVFCDDPDCGNRDSNGLHWPGGHPNSREMRERNTTSKPCGCKIEAGYQGLISVPNGIRYCSLHAAAPELLEEIIRFHNFLDIAGKHEEKCEQLRILIKRAEGK